MAGLTASLLTSSAPTSIQPDRRSLLFSAAAAGVGVLLGYTVGSQPQGVPGLDATERKEIGGWGRGTRS